MVKLIDAMILWDKQHLDSDRGPAVKVVNHTTQEQVQCYRYLTSSVGCCYRNWATVTDLERAACVLSLFNQIVIKDGIPADQVHAAFMEIDEYAEFQDDVRNPDNPFWRLAYEAF